MTQPLANIWTIAMMKYHVEKCNPTVTVLDGKLDDIEKGNTDHHAIAIEAFEATFEASHARHGRLYLDWFALTDLAAWLQCEMPNATFKAFSRRFLQFFPGSSEITE